MNCRSCRLAVGMARAAGIIGVVLWACWCVCWLVVWVSFAADLLTPGLQDANLLAAMLSLDLLPPGQNGCQGRTAAKAGRQQGQDSGRGRKALCSWRSLPQPPRKAAVASGCSLAAAALWGVRCSKYLAHSDMKWQQLSGGVPCSKYLQR